MSNSIALITKYLPIVDKVYKLSSKTSILDNTALSRESEMANQIYLASMVLQGLGDYDRNTGYVDGDATISWLIHQFTQDRGRRFIIDTLDNLETAGIAFGQLVGEFLRTKVIPEVDAYRITKYVADAGNSASADITTASALVTALDLAMQTQDDLEVPEEGKLLYLSNAMYNLLKNATNLNREIGIGNDGTFNRKFMTFDGMRVEKMPKTRFYTAITQYDGSTAGQEAGGYIKNASTGKDINFLMIHPSAVAYQGTKHVVNKVISPEANQTSDGWIFPYRLYHDVFIADNKTDGIYVHNKTT